MAGEGTAGTEAVGEAGVACSRASGALPPATQRLPGHACTRACALCRRAGSPHPPVPGCRRAPQPRLLLSRAQLVPHGWGKAVAGGPGHLGGLAQQPEEDGGKHRRPISPATAAAAATHLLWPPACRRAASDPFKRQMMLVGTAAPQRALHAVLGFDAGAARGAGVVARPRLAVARWRRKRARVSLDPRYTRSLAVTHVCSLCLTHASSAPMRRIMRCAGAVWWLPAAPGWADGAQAGGSTAADWLVGPPSLASSEVTQPGTPHRSVHLCTCR